MTGEEIRNARKQLGLTQAEFAVVMGLPGNTYVSNLEAERERLSKPAQKIGRAHV